MVKDSRQYDMGVLVFSPKPVVEGKLLGKQILNILCHLWTSVQRWGFQSLVWLRVTLRTKVLRVSYTL